METKIKNKWKQVTGNLFLLIVGIIYLTGGIYLILIGLEETLNWLFGFLYMVFSLIVFVVLSDRIYNQTRKTEEDLEENEVNNK